MIIYLTVIILQVTLSMNKFTNNVIPTYFQFIQPPSIETKVWHNLHLNKSVLKYLSWMLETWMEYHLVSDSYYNTVNLCKE